MLGQQATGEEVANQMVDGFLRTSLMGAHQQVRVNKIRVMEQEIPGAKRVRM